VLSNGGNGGVMTVLRGGNLKKRHSIVVAWQVYNGGAMTAAIAMAV